MEIVVCSVKEMYRLLAGMDRTEGIGVILCTLEPVRTEYLEGVPYLLLPFADTENESSGDAFTPRMAGRVRDFAGRMQAAAANLYICCDSGESRSSALAAAVCRGMGMDEMWVWENAHYHPNLLVYRLQCQAMGKPVSESGLRHRHEISENALAEMIRKARRGSRSGGRADQAGK